MQGGEDQVARFRRRQCGLNGIEVAHLADEDNVRVLTQDRPQAVCVASGVFADLALVDDALIRLVDVLDRVFQRDDVAAPRNG